MQLRSRRQFLHGSLGLVGVSLLSGCGALPPRGQQPAKLPRIGILSPASTTSGVALAAFQQGLRELGYVEGQNIALEWGLAQGDSELLPDLAAELVRLNVDVLVTDGPAAVQAARQATGTIAIVAPTLRDPVRDGLAASLARPGGNVTGLVLTMPGLYAKRLELLRDAVPGLSRVAVLWDSATQGPSIPETQAAAQVLGLQVRALEIRSPEEFEGAFGAASRERVDGAFSHAGPMFFAERARIVELAAQHGLPGMFPEKEYAEAGGLMVYGPNVFDNFRRTATHVDKILKGAQPADLPVEQPTRFDLVLNLKTARALGLTIPQEVLMQATEVIQ